MPDVEAYISQFKDVQKHKLEELRSLLQKLMPDAEECIAYKMPAFRTSQVVCYYAACKNHIGFYPTSKPILHFREALSTYKHSKGAVQFKLNEPFPDSLIADMIRFRLSDMKRNS